MAGADNKDLQINRKAQPASASVDALLPIEVRYFFDSAQ